MITKTVTYTDYFGVERTEEYCFHLSKAELTMMNMAEYGAIDKRLKKIVDAKETPEIMEQFRTLLRDSYGKISPDGRRFMKSKELSDEFEQTEAYAQIFMELCTDPKAAAAFAAGVIPKDLAEAVEKDKENGKVLPLSIEGSTEN